MKKYSFIGFALVIVVLITAACQKDIILEPLPTLEGTYNGLFMVIDGYQSTNDTTKSTVEMMFDDKSYFFNSDNIPDVFCSPRGDYILAANNIEFTETDDNCGGVVAKQSDNPRGQFSIQRPADSIIMIKQDSTTLKKFLLKKI